MARILFASHHSSPLYEATMGFFVVPSFIMLLALGFAQAASAQQQPAPHATALPPNTAMTLTGKERLGEKWKDEQRIDNCKVPADKRGIRPRPSTCPHVPMG